ncbi:MAG TPA: glycoside hydrolase family 38 C-terminal domain-containing protein, partial [Tepidiformaceae bacterium]
EYNAEILPGAITRPAAVELLGTASDAVSATLRYRTVLEVPAALTATRTRRQGKAPVELPMVTEVRLWAGMPRVDFRVTVENRAQDHRLRALFPLPFAVSHAITENQFHVAERPIEPPPWNGISAELPPTTFPQKTFAAFERDGHGLAVFNRGLPEGEVVGDRRGRQAYALTLLRCVGWLSRSDLTSRRGGAGPSIATFDSQMPGDHTFEYSLMTYRGTWREAGVQAMAHSFAFPPMAWATNRHDGSHRGTLPLATLTPDAVVPSAMHRSDEDGAPVIRVYNASGEAVEAAIEVPAAMSGADLVDLLERPAGDLAGDGHYRFSMRPWGIASLRLRKHGISVERGEGRA